MYYNHYDKYDFVSSNEKKKALFFICFYYKMFICGLNRNSKFKILVWSDIFKKNIYLPLPEIVKMDFPVITRNYLKKLL